VPILKSDDLAGVIVIYHQEVRPFTDNQIALVETFADQAAIAIENVRLLDELRQRTDELGRSVEELRALGEVSQAVNSTLDLETVLTTIVSRAVQLSRTDAGAIYVFDDERQEFRLHATFGMSETMIAAITDQRIGPAIAVQSESAASAVGPGRYSLRHSQRTSSSSVFAASSEPGKPKSPPDHSTLSLWGLRPPFDLKLRSQAANSSSSPLASFRSRVSKPH
jgi:GAF domain-containing protein